MGFEPTPSQVLSLMPLPNWAKDAFAYLQRVELCPTGLESAWPAGGAAPAAAAGAEWVNKPIKMGMQTRTRQHEANRQK